MWTFYECPDATQPDPLLLLTVILTCPPSEKAWLKAGEPAILPTPKLFLAA